MQKSFDKSEGNRNGIEPLFPVTFNPSRRADFCVRQNTASCVLRHSKPGLVPQNNLPCWELEKTSKVGFLCGLSKDELAEARLKMDL